MDKYAQEKLYGVAYGLYETGDYEKAIGFFTHLIFGHPFEGRYWRGLAAARQMKQDYQGAVQAWGMLAILETEDARPHFHAAECLLSLGEKEEASKALSCAEKLPNAPLDQIALLKGVLW